MAQVYAVVYSSTEKKCLVFWKKQFARYRRLREGEFKGTPTKINGGGLFCFPGGGLEAKDSGNPIAGAYREFLEETGVDLSGLALTDVFPKTAAPPYYAVLFDVNAASFGDIFRQCNQNIVHKEAVLNRIGSEEELTQKKLEQEGVVIQDDELELVKQVNLVVIGDYVKGDDGNTYFTKGDGKTDWFYDIVQQNPAVFPKTK